MKTKTLYFKEGKSDKVYVATVNGGTVTLAWGRRGAAMQTKTVKLTPADADALYESKLAEKIGKGYHEGEGHNGFVSAEITLSPELAQTFQAGVDKGVALMNEPSPLPQVCAKCHLVPQFCKCAVTPKPQLLNELTEAELLATFKKPEFFVQQKQDGNRILLRRDGAGVTSFSRTGKITTVFPKAIANAALALPRCLLDGEIVGNTIYAFDLLEIDRRSADGALLDIRKLPYEKRLAALEKLLPATDELKGGIVCVVTARTNEQKLKLFADVKAAGGEGVVLKNKDASYTAGRPNTGGPALKFKFVATATVVVTSHHKVHSSVRMALADGTDVGSVTIPPNKTLPPVGALIEVRYLYAHHGGSLAQAVYLGVRDDIEAADTQSQLKYKNEGEELSAK